MEKPQNKRPTSLKDIIRYLTGASTPRQRNLMEKEMEKDPFLEDAVQGFSEADKSRAQYDISELNRRIKGHASQTPVWFRMGVAASLALMIMAGLGYLYLEMSGRQGTGDQLALEQYRDTVEEEKRAAFYEYDEETVTEYLPVPDTAPVDIIPEPLPVAPVLSEKAEESLPGIAEVEEDYFADREISEAGAAPLETLVRPEFAEAVRAVSHVSLHDDLSDALVEAKPEGGYELYFQYIEESAFLEYDSGLASGWVRLSFEINEDGQPVAFEVIESPDAEMAERAIKIVESGPRWLPASKNGNFYNQRINLSIRFWE